MTIAVAGTPFAQLMEYLRLLKQMPRTGWWARGIPQPENVAAHSYGVAFWTLWLTERHNAQHPNAPIDLAKALSMAILHDLPEAITGDLMPSQKRALFGPNTHDQKQAMYTAESRFWDHLQSKNRTPGTSPTATQTPPATTPPSMGDDPTRTLQDFTRQISVRWQALWQDYRDAKSLEARVIKQADALDCVLQAIAYRQLYRAPLADFQGLLSKASGDDEALHDFLQQAWAETEAPALGTKA